MFKQTLAAAFVAAAFVSAPASAGIVFDGFGDRQAEVVANFATPAGSSATVINVTDTSLASLQRAISAVYTGSSGTGIGGDVKAEVQDGIFAHSQEARTLGYTQIDWSFKDGVAQNLIGWAGLSLNITVVEQDQTSPTMTFTVRDADGTQLFSNFTLSKEVEEGDAPVSYSANFSGFVADASNAGHVAGFDWSQFLGASLKIDGSATSNLDVAIDIVEVPAPAPLALLGLGLVGLGVARRRRA